MKACVFLLICLLLASALVCTPTPTSLSQVDATPGGDATLATLVAQQLTAAAAPATPDPAGSLTSAALPPSGTAGALRVVYSQGGNIHLWDANGSKQLTASGQDTEPKISDDGALAVFRRNGELWAVAADGTHEHSLVSTAALAALPHAQGGLLVPDRFDFAPRSHDLYFNTLLSSQPFPVPQDDLVRVNPDNASFRPLLNSGPGDASFTFSPDGTKIALSRSDRIDIFDLQTGTGKTVFTFPVVMMYSVANYLPEIAWMPDGSGFKTVIPAPDALGSPAAPTRFMFVPADGSQAAQLAEFVAVPAFKDRPYISPDGAQVLYLKPQGNNFELHLIDASTADKAVFQHPADKFGLLGWAPDSLHFVYWIDSPQSAWLGSTGAQGVLLSDVPGADHIAWVQDSLFLFENGTGLRLRTLGQPSLLIAGGVADAFDFCLPR